VLLNKEAEVSLKRSVLLAEVEDGCSSIVECLSKPCCNHWWYTW